MRGFYGRWVMRGCQRACERICACPASIMFVVGRKDFCYCLCVLIVPVWVIN